MATALTLKQAIAAVWQKFMGVIGYADISGIGDGTVKGAIAGLNGKLNTKIRQKHVDITTDQYGQYNLKQHLPGGEGTILNVHSGSGQYGIFLYAGNTIRVCNVGTGDFSLANNASFDIYIIYTLSAYLEN